MEEQQVQGGAAPQPNAGQDIESQIHDGVVAFMQSQDPAIAVEVVTMIASMMGIAPQVNSYSEQAPAPMSNTPATSPQVPMGRHGMRMYRAGGKILRNGGNTDPNPKKKKGVTTQLVAPKTSKRTLFQSQDMNEGRVNNRETTPELGKAMRESVNKTLKRSRVQALGKAGKDIAEGGGQRIGNKAVYDSGKGRMELAGEFTDLEFEVPGFDHTLPPLDIFSREGSKQIEGKPSVEPGLIPASEIRQKYGKGPKRRLRRVPYLEGKGYGHNKRTESGY